MNTQNDFRFHTRTMRAAAVALLIAILPSLHATGSPPDAGLEREAERSADNPAAGQQRGALIYIPRFDALAGSIQNAVNGLEPSDTILLGPGTISESGIVIDKPLTIRGQGIGVTIIDGGMTDRVFQIQFADLNGGASSFPDTGVPVVFEDLTIRNGLTTGPGGGINIPGNTGNYRFSRVRFENNQAMTGGAFAIGQMTFVQTSDFLIEGCEFEGNTATDSGGACTFADWPRTHRIVNSLFRNNSASTAAAAISTIGSTAAEVHISNCTFVEHPLNSTGDDSLLRVGAMGGSIQVANSIVADNVSGRLQGGHSGSSIRRSVLGPGTTLQSFSNGAGNTTVAPTFVDAPGGDFRLASGSSGIDIGDLPWYYSLGGGGRDQGGDPRFINDPLTTDTGTAGSSLDAGAYEYQTTDTDTSCPGDINGDGVIDTADLGILIGVFGTGCP